jgi:hypothetical protein
MVQESVAWVSEVSVIGSILRWQQHTRPVSDACGETYMVVDRSHRRIGIGKAMIAEMISRFPHVELTCFVSKVPFYEKQGFQGLDVHNTQVVISTRNHSPLGKIGIIDGAAIAKTPEAGQILNGLVQHWGRKAMIDAEKKLLIHLDQITREAEIFVRDSLAAKPH